MHGNQPTFRKRCFQFSKTEANQGIGTILGKLKQISLNIHFFVNMLLVSKVFRFCLNFNKFIN